MSIYAAYRNGIADGYGFSQEPCNMGYRQAGEYLRKYMAHRWPHLLCRNKFKFVREEKRPPPAMTGSLLGQRHFSKWASCESGDGGVAFLEHRRCANKLAQGRAQRRPGF